MLSCFNLTRVGFDQSINLNDVFEFENNYWIIRCISKSEIKTRIVKGFNGLYGRQADVIIAIVAAQKVGTCNNSNLLQTTESLIYTKKIDGKFAEEEITQIGELMPTKDIIYVLKEIENIKYSFVDIRISFLGTSITEIPIVKSKELVKNKKLNELGWKIGKN